MLRIVLTTCNRPRLFGLLADDLIREVGDAGAHVSVVDDGTRQAGELAGWRGVFLARGWDWTRHDAPHGAGGYYAVLSEAFAREHDAWIAAGTPTDWIWLILQDDLRLCRDFRARLVSAWSAAATSFSAHALMIHIDATREGHVVAASGGVVERVDWLDCITALSADALSAFGWRFMAHRPRGTGSTVGNYMLGQFRRRGFAIARTAQSLVVHADAPSVMNPAVKRAPGGMRTVRYIDGDEARDALESGRAR
jgi:hypothetical protein